MASLHSVLDDFNMKCDVYEVTCVLEELLPALNKRCSYGGCCRLNKQYDGFGPCVNKKCRHSCEKDVMKYEGYQCTYSGPAVDMEEKQFKCKCNENTSYIQKCMVCFDVPDLWENV